MVTVDDVRQVVRGLPRSSEHLIADRVKFRVGSIVYVAFSRDETVMGFAFPKEERPFLIAFDPATFHAPRESELRFNWIEAQMSRLDVDRMTELVLDAWRMVVPKKVWTAWQQQVEGTTASEGR
ncbi:MmcQ/YjbR family DNA-binding protein [Actinoplanes sp. URMC 104]|uniref:MmcQ/YjbR family DNA-binding protein n=1 Tax=Actinoplanes sp. URMC 104 TaxID=3423409 RepID=UPI003F196451